ncbi:hypothetical protein [Photobacterium leiognathi]|uniref:hypothetical protein n=1 Tax=Photobacterium leiognathi TaxID=553611 RepID=UPI00298174BB|nr:hypothetical protein [Photobacterium leiognathi]
MTDKLKQHRVIGIRHALKEFKDKGLISSKINFPEDASEEVIELIIDTAIEFYNLGAKISAEKVIDHFIDEKFETNKRNGNRRVIANVNAVSWQHTFPVDAGIKREKVINRVRIPIKDLGFE